jgi:hypothetical protein
MIFELCYDNRWLYFGITIMQGRDNSLTLANFALMLASLPGLPLLIFGKISEPNLFKPLSLSLAHCVLSPGSLRAN